MESTLTKVASKSSITELGDLSVMISGTYAMPTLCVASWVCLQPPRLHVVEGLEKDKDRLSWMMYTAMAQKSLCSNVDLRIPVIVRTAKMQVQFAAEVLWQVNELLEGHVQRAR